MKILIKNTCNIRKQPTTQSKVIATANGGDKFDAVIKTGEMLIDSNGKQISEWYELSVGGYVWGGNVTVYNPQLEIDAKLAKFVADWNNKHLEVRDPSNRNQCYDLCDKWCQILGKPFFYTLFAQDIFYNFDKNHWIQTKNGLFNKPKAGDVVVFNSPNGVGHVAVALNSSTMFTANVFSQNDPLGSPCGIKYYSYWSPWLKVTGWLSPIL